jgi:hypothetical protein
LAVLDNWLNIKTLLFFILMRKPLLQVKKQFCAAASFECGSASGFGKEKLGDNGYDVYLLANLEKIQKFTCDVTPVQGNYAVPCGSGSGSNKEMMWFHAAPALVPARK